MASYWERITNDRMGRRRLLKGSAAFSVGAAALALIGCSSDDNGSTDAGPLQTPGTTGSTGNAKPGGLYATYFSNMGNYNVAAFYHDGYNNSGITVYDRPITARADTKGYQLEAMEKIELAEPTKVVMTLKPGMVYQNKAPVNGRAVKASDIVNYQNYVKALPNAENALFQRTFLDRVEAPDDNTVIYYLKSPSAYLFSSTYLANPTAQPIVPKEVVDAIEQTPAVGSGPFELVEHTFGQKYVYKKFEQFREAKRGMPYFTNRESYSLTDAVAQEAAFRSGQITEWQPTGTLVDRLLNELDKTKYANTPYLAYSQVGMNSMMNAQLGGPRPWHDVRVREAIYRLTNKQQHVDLAYARKAVVNQTPIQAGLTAWLLDAKDTEKYYKEDVAAAKQLLSAANFDSGKEWLVVCSNTTAINATMAEVWQQQLGRADIKLRIQAMPLAEILPNYMNNGKFDFWIGSQPGGDTPARALRNHHSNTNDLFNNVGLYNKDIDALIEKSEQETNREENVKQVKDIQKKILDQYSLSFNTLTPQNYLFYDARLQDFIIDPFVGQDYQYQAWFS
ncbi:MAG: ABC transporter substrate-binding protein [Dehalococcoidia bacterium]